MTYQGDTTPVWLFLSILLMNLAGCGPSGTDNSPYIDEFYAPYSTIARGNCTYAVVNYHNGSGVIDNGVGYVAPGYSVQLCPSTTTTYTLIVTNSDGQSTSRQQTIWVVDGPAISSFTSGHASILRGGSTSLLAVYENGSGSIDNSVGFVTSGVPVTVSPNLTTTYTLTVRQSSTHESVFKSVTVEVLTAISIESFTASSDTVMLGDSFVLTPVFSGGTGFIAEGSIGSVTSGTPITITPSLPGTYTYTLKVTDPYTHEFITSSISVDVFSTFPTGILNTARTYHTATLLNNGQVLVAGGGSEWNISLDSAELYDPSTGTFAITGNMNSVRMEHTATLLADGKVLLVGGRSAGSALVSAELYDPVTGTFSSTGSMHVARSNHTATLLPDGKVLVTGGWYGEIASAEIYDPATGVFTAIGDMSVARFDHTATLLNDGRVLLAGGRNLSTGTSLSSAELYDYQAQTFSSASSFNMARYLHCATRLADGKVLFVAGNGAGTPLSSAELYDPVTGNFTLTGSRGYSQGPCRSILLADGTVLSAGGSSPAIEIYDPVTGVFTKTGSMASANSGFSLTSLNDGTVLISAGWFSNIVTDFAEIYYP